MNKSLDSDGCLHFIRARNLIQKQKGAVHKVCFLLRNFAAVGKKFNLCSLRLFVKVSIRNFLMSGVMRQLFHWKMNILYS